MTNTFTESTQYHYCRCHPTSYDVESILTLDDGVEVSSCLCGVLWVFEREQDEGPKMEELIDWEEHVVTYLTGPAAERYLNSERGRLEQFTCLCCGAVVTEAQRKVFEGELYHLSCWQDEMTSKDQAAYEDVDRRELAYPGVSL
jgi:hypothetical protein